MIGPDISVVQGEGLAILVAQDAIEKAKDDYEAFKRALLVRADYDPRKIYPDYFPAQDMNDVPDGDDVDYDYSAVEWKGPSDTDKKELENILKLLADSGGSVSFGDARMGGGGWV